MVLNKRGLVVVLVLVVVGLLYVFDGDITGEVVWEPVTDLSSCGVDISALWDEIINESSVGIVQIIEGCEFVAWKNISQTEILALRGHTKDTNLEFNIYDLPNGSVGDIIESNWIEAYYVNHTDVNITANYSLETTVNGVVGLLYNSLNDWALGDEAETLAKYEQYFKIEVPSITWSVVVSDYMDSSFITNTTNIVNYLKVHSYESYISFFYNIARYSVVEKPVFTQTISDFALETNSSWNEAFNLSVISNIDSIDNRWSVTTEVLVSSDNIVTANLSDNVMYFKPNIGENGTDIFRIIISAPGGYNIYSNNFNVTIVDDINDAPVLMREIPDIGIPWASGAEVYLDIYFKDMDGDNLTYSVGGSVELLDINITDDVMVVRLEDGFNSSQIWVYADDGVAETKSNKFWVYDSSNSVAVAFVTNVSVDGDLNESVSGNTTSGVVGNESVSSVGVDDTGSNNNDGLMVWIIGVVVGLILVLFIIWFFILRNKKASVPEGGVVPSAPHPPGGLGAPMGTVIADTVPQNPVNSYLSNLNLSKK